VQVRANRRIANHPPPCWEGWPNRSHGNVDRPHRGEHVLVDGGRLDPLELEPHPGARQLERESALEPSRVVVFEGLRRDQTRHPSDQLACRLPRQGGRADDRRDRSRPFREGRAYGCVSVGLLLVLHQSPASPLYGCIVLLLAQVVWAFWQFAFGEKGVCTI